MVGGVSDEEKDEVAEGKKIELFHVPQKLKPFKFSHHLRS